MASLPFPLPQAEVGTLKKRVEEVVGENERLSEEMVRQADMLQRRAQAEHAALPYQTQELLQRLELLTRENDILLEQQRALDGEISSLHAQLDKRATESASLSAEFASIMERLQSGERYLEQLERDKGESDKSVRRLTAERNALREQLQDAQAQCHSLTEQSAQSKGILEETGQRFKADTEALKQQLALLQKRERQAAVNAQTLARELEALREQHGSASRELTTARQDTNEMVQAVSRMEAQLAAYQQKDAEVYQRLKEAMEMAEDAKLARDELLMRERHLENEVASLRDKLKTHYKEIKEQYRQEMASQQAKADKAVTSLTAELHMMEATNAELKLVAEKALRDQRAADVELEHLRATLAAFGASGAAQRNAAATGVTLAGPGLGRGLAGLQGVPEPRPTTLEGPSSASQARRIQELERALDEEQDKQKSVSLSCQRKLNEWERERNSLVTTLTDIRNRAQRAEIEVVERRKQCVQLKASGDELQRVNRALQRAKSLAEKEAKVNYKRMEAEYGNQVRVLEDKLEHAVSLYNRSSDDAEGIVRARDELVAKWKEESKTLATQLASMEAEHSAERGRLVRRVEELAQQLEALHKERGVAMEQLVYLQQEVDSLRPALKAAEKRASELSAQMSVVLDNEEGLIRAKGSLQSELDKLKLANARLERQRDGLQIKFGAMADKENVVDARSSHAEQVALMKKLQEIKDEKAGIQKVLTGSVL
eukprot:jgi/Mesvir1/10972/Mv07854-RA.1